MNKMFELVSVRPFTQLFLLFVTVLDTTVNEVYVTFILELSLQSIDKFTLYLAYIVFDPLFKFLTMLKVSKTTSDFVTH